MTSEFSIAVHALVYLYNKNTVLSSDELSENICTNSARVRKVMAKLKKAGFVNTKEGVRGGYEMNKNPEKITLKKICECLQVDIVKMSWKTGNIDLPCMVSSGMSGVMDELAQNMNELCMDYLNKITITDINQKIFNTEK